MSSKYHLKLKKKYDSKDNSESMINSNIQNKKNRVEKHNKLILV